MTRTTADRQRLTHVRRPALPWRESRVTECGDRGRAFPAELVIDRAELVARVQAQGIRAVRDVTCRVCLANTQRLLSSTWADDPVRLLARELAAYALYPDRDPTLILELRAIATMVDRHRDEFDALVAALAEVPQLGAGRQRRRRPDGR